jgi:signal transduction histidine kinase
MLKFKRLGIGYKITTGLLAFLFLLAIATSWLVQKGFGQAEQRAAQRSEVSLQNQSQTALIQLTALEAQLLDNGLHRAASLTEIAAEYVVDAHSENLPIDWAQSSKHVVWSGLQLTLSNDGLLYYDANPARSTEILHPGNIPPDMNTDRILQNTAILDELFPALLEQVDTAVGIYFQGPQLTFRYYPVRDLPKLEIENGAAEAAQQMHIEDFAVAPPNNPERNTIWLAPYVDDAGQGLLVSANTPVYFDDDFQGYIGIDVSLARLIEHLNNLKPTPDSFAFLVDANGMLIAVPPEYAAKLIGQNHSAGETSPTGLLGLSLEETTPILGPVLPNATQNVQPGAAALALEGEEMLVTYAPMPEMGWSLSVVVPLREVTAEAQAVSESIRSDGHTTVRNTLLAMSTFFLLATAGSILFSYRSITYPLRQLLQGVRAVISGEHGVLVPVSSQDEIGELAASFNQMTGELQKRTLQLTETSSELEIKKAQVQVAALEERQRLARELHDSVSQALYGIALGARTARTLLDRDPAKVVEPLDYVLSLAEAGLSEMRALIFELRPESLQNEGLIAALSKQVDALKARHKLEVKTSFCPEPGIPLDAKVTLYRIAQEAFNNISRHAEATEVKVSLQWDDGWLTLQIRDNGKGFDPHQAFPGHLGLQSMRERIVNQGGSLDISSQSGKGTVVTARLKIENHQ